MDSVIFGARHLAHSEIYRYDKVVQQIFNCRRAMASQGTFSRLFRTLNKEINDKIFPTENRFRFDQIQQDKLAIDFDSTVLTHIGHKKEQSLLQDCYQYSSEISKGI